MKETFSQQVKNEIIQRSGKLLPCCMLASLSAVVYSGEIAINSAGIGFSLNSSNLSFVKFVANICAKLYGIQSDIIAEKTSSGRSNYALTISHPELLFDCGVLFRDGNGLTQISKCTGEYLLEQECCKKSFIIASFLANGNVVVPKMENSTTGYKLEFLPSNQEQSDLLLNLLSYFGFTFKCLERKSVYSVYVQDSDVVCDFLVFLGASDSMLSLENVKAELYMRSQANRQANCVIANIDKSVAASTTQIAAIKHLIEKGLMNSVDPRIQDFANARMENPSATMNEIADILKISKSGAVHRMRKLLLLADMSETKDTPKE